jgi:hypothetical protein
VTTPIIEVESATPETKLTWSVPSLENPELGYPAVPALQPNSEYTVCLTLFNAFGSQVGPEVHFPTLSTLPAIQSESVVSRGVAGMELEAMINPFLQETTYFFEYATSEAALEHGKGTVIHGSTGLLQTRKLEELKKREERLKVEEEKGLVPPRNRTRSTTTPRSPKTNRPRSKAHPPMARSSPTACRSSPPKRRKTSPAPRRRSRGASTQKALPSPTTSRT